MTHIVERMEDIEKRIAQAGAIVGCSKTGDQLSDEYRAVDVLNDNHTGLPITSENNSVESNEDMNCTDKVIEQDDHSLNAVGEKHDGNECIPSVSVDKQCAVLNKEENTKDKNRTPVQVKTEAKVPTVSTVSTTNSKVINKTIEIPTVGKHFQKKGRGRPPRNRSSTGDCLKTVTVSIQGHFKDMFNAFYELQKSGKYCDLKLCLSNGHVFMHSVVFVASSPEMLRIFQDSLQIESEDVEFKILHLEGVSMEAMDKVVAFLYTGNIEFQEQEREDLIKTAEMLGLETLHKQIKTGKRNATHQVDQVPHKKRKQVSKDRASSKWEKKQSKPKPNTRRKQSKVKTLKVKDEIVNNLNYENNRTLDEVTEDEKIIVVKEETDSHLEEVKCKDEDLNLNHAYDNECDGSGNDTDSYYADERDILHFDLNTGGKESVSDRQGRSVNVSKPEPARTKKKGGAKIKLVKRSEKKEKLKHGGLVNETEKRPDFDIFTPEKRKRVPVPAPVDEPVEETVFEDEAKLTEDEDIPKDFVFPASIVPGCGGECDKCGLKFKFQVELTYHRNKCLGPTNRQRRKCVTCLQQFDNTEAYVDHRNNDANCIALRKEKLEERHKKRFQMRRRYSCCVCTRKFRRTADKVEHEFLAHEIKYDKEKYPDLYCEMCNYWCMNPWRLRHHQQVSCNKGQEPICDVCGNSYKNEKTLQKHKELMHLGAAPLLTCDECGKTLKGKKGLKHHIRLKHKGENLHNFFMCHVCSKTYRTSNELTFHLYKVHKQPVPEGYTIYKCPDCDYEHNNKRFYEKHLVLHGDKREWQCDVCAKAFKTRNHLSTHRTIHTAERIPCPFEECSYKALKKGHLKNHIENQHTQKGEKNAKCHLCDYSTFFRGNLIKHQRAVHKLEVVTRYSVEMKAKYKNLKSGEIVGVSKEQTGDQTEDYRPDQNQRKMLGLVQDMSHSGSDTFASSAENSVMENSGHFVREKTMLDQQQRFVNDKQMGEISSPPSGPTDAFIYSVANASFLSRQANLQTNMNIYGMPPLDFSMYQQGPTDQM